MSEIPIFIVGDPHGQWRPIHLACRQSTQVGMLILLGDCELQVPLTTEFAAEIADGWRIHWIIGNHDVDNIEYYDHLTGSMPYADLGGHVLDVNHMRIGGLGGVYLGRVWYPRLSDSAAPTFETRAQYLRQVRRNERWRSGLPLRFRGAIFPEDHELLKGGRHGGRLEVLVCHEAPDTRAMKGKGFHGISQLLDETRTRVCIHGHHHTSYIEDHVLPSGRICEVRGLAIGEVWRLELPA